MAYTNHDAVLMINEKNESVEVFHIYILRYIVKDVCTHTHEHAAKHKHNTDKQKVEKRCILPCGECKLIH